MSRIRVGVLISGRGSNMSALVEASRAPDCPYEIVLVLSNRPDAPGLDAARALGINRVTLDRKLAELAITVKRGQGVVEGEDEEDEER